MSNGFFRFSTHVLCPLNSSVAFSNWLCKVLEFLATLWSSSTCSFLLLSQISKFFPFSQSSNSINSHGYHQHNLSDFFLSISTQSFTPIKTLSSEDLVMYSLSIYPPWSGVLHSLSLVFWSSYPTHPAALLSNPQSISISDYWNCSEVYRQYYLCFTQLRS